MERQPGTVVLKSSIPALLLEDGTAITDGADAIIAHLDAHYSERADAAAHRERAS